MKKIIHAMRKFRVIASLFFTCLTVGRGVLTPSKSYYGKVSTSSRQKTAGLLAMTHERNLHITFILIVAICSLLFLIWTAGVFSQEELPISSLFIQQADSIVLVGTKGRKDGKLGSGFIIRADGLIVTNYHLIKNAKKIYVKLRNDTGYRSVRLINADASKDIALIKVNGRGLKPVKLGNSNHVQIGQRVVTIGSPLGLESTVADGLISAVRATDKDFKLFQISVPLSNGSSGGPLFNLKGEVVGITTASYLKGQNLNFAVPINYIKPLVSKPSDPKEGRRSGNQRSYVVQPDDTLYGLAKKFKTTVTEIMEANKLTDSKIYSGQRLTIPR